MQKKTTTSKPANSPKPKPGPADEGAGDEGEDAGSIFDNTKPQGQVEPGNYEAVMFEAVLQDADEKGRSARIKYKIATEGDARGTDVTAFYKLFEDQACKKPGRGIDFLKRDLPILGQGDVRFADLEDCFATLQEEQPGVVVTVKHKDGYQNVYLKSLCEEDVIADFKDTNPF